MTQKARALDQWIRTDFRQINTELEELYFDNPEFNRVLRSRDQKAIS